MAKEAEAALGVSALENRTGGAARIDGSPRISGINVEAAGKCQQESSSPSKISWISSKSCRRASSDAEVMIDLLEEDYDETNRRGVFKGDARAAEKGHVRAALKGAAARAEYDANGAILVAACGRGRHRGAGLGGDAVPHVYALVRAAPLWGAPARPSSRETKRGSKASRSRCRASTHMDT